MREEQTLAEIEDFIEGFKQPTGAVCGSMGSGSRPGHPSTGGRGTAGRGVDDPLTSPPGCACFMLDVADFSFPPRKGSIDSL